MKKVRFYNVISSWVFISSFFFSKKKIAREIKKQRVDSSIFVDIAATEEARDSILMCPSLSSLGTGLKIEPDDFLAADRTMRAGSIQPFLVCTSRLHRHANFLLHPNQFFFITFFFFHLSSGFINTN